MAYPISELITQNIVDTLKGVGVLSGDTGDLKVERFKLRGNTPADLLAIVCEGGDEEESDDNTPMGFKQWRRTYEVVIYVEQSEEVDVPYEQRVNIARADVERALMRDVSRGGYACNTEIRDPLLFTDANDVGGIMVNAEVTYRHSETDPYSQS